MLFFHSFDKFFLSIFTCFCSYRGIESCFRFRSVFYKKRTQLCFWSFQCLWFNKEKKPRLLLEARSQRETNGWPSCEVIILLLIWPLEAARGCCCCQEDEGRRRKPPSKRPQLLRLLGRPCFTYELPYSMQLTFIWLYGKPARACQKSSWKEGVGSSGQKYFFSIRSNIDDKVATIFYLFWKKIPLDASL